MSRVWRLRIKEGTLSFMGSRRNPEDREVDQTTVKYCAAQTIPSEILRAILSHLPHNTLKNTLASCTLVCRAWTVESSALLFRQSVIRCDSSLDTIFFTVVCGYIVSRREWRHIVARPQYFCSAVLESDRITRSLQDLEVVGCDQDNCLDILSLKEVVFHVPNLRSLKLGLLRFMPLSSHERSSLAPRAQDRRPLDTLVLRGGDRRMIHVPARPTVWDVLLWFDRVGCLDISEKLPFVQPIARSKTSTGTKVRVRVERLITAQDGCVTALLDVPPPKPRTVLGLRLPKRFNFDSQGLMDLLDLSCLSSLQVPYLTEYYFDPFNAFLHQYGSKLVECRVLIHPGTSSSAQVPKCLSFAHASGMLQKCTFAYETPLEHDLRDQATLQSSTWNRLLKTFVANASLEQLNIEFRLRCYLSQPAVYPYLPFLAALDWSPLDCLPKRDPSASPLLNVQVAFWFQQQLSFHPQRPWRAVTSQFKDIVATALPPFAHAVVSFRLDD